MPVIGHRHGDVSVRRAEQRRRTITIITIVTAAPLRDGCDDGDGHRLLLWSARTYIPQAKGVLPRQKPMRGVRAQHCATVRPENKVCRVCGSHPAVRASGANAQSAWASAESCGGRKVRTWVRTGFAGLHPKYAKGPPETGPPFPCRDELQEMEATCGAPIVSEAPFG